MRLISLIQSRPDLFPQADLATYYSFDMYHVMGSLLLTRSFTVKDEIMQGVQTRESVPEGESNADSMMIQDGQDMSQDPESMEVDDDDDDDEHEEEVIVLPLADMLNARYGHDNVCFLFALSSLVIDV